MNLTEHFSLSEFTRSSVAERNHIDNTIPSCFIPSLRNLCLQVLEPLRLYANEPVIISSGYRCPELNRLVGGVSNSQHLIGEAADIYCEETIRLRQWYLWILDNCPFDQLIWECSCKPSGKSNSFELSRGAAELGRSQRSKNRYWIHVSCKPDLSQNRQQARSNLKNA